ncbi:MAG: hypothetical protein CSA22_03670 [Deltaproteobacteria bacterium]|nr:MAG: hypothetical protein CSA22_03670 [Deltaproteobacteria bacterium]
MRILCMLGVCAASLFVMTFTAGADMVQAVSFGPDKGTLETAGFCHSCTVVARQKLFDGMYKVFYEKALPDGSTCLESVDVIQTSGLGWRVLEPRQVAENQI